MTSRLSIPIIDADAEEKGRAEPTRRALLQWLAASAALAASSGCSRAPASRIYSYDAMPEIEAQGVPQFYASACTRAGYAQGVLVGTQQGRPIKVEGNPQHPASLGGTSVFEQAAILQLWDPDRSTAVWQRGADGRELPSTWQAFEAAWHARPADAPLHVLTPAFTSPSLAAELAALLQKRPGSHWYRDDAAPNLAARRGATLAFGRELRAVHDFAAAELIVAVGGDPFSDAAAGVRHSADWARARSAALAAGHTPARLVALETTPGLFGARADERWALPPLSQERVLWRVAASLLKGLAPITVSPAEEAIAARLAALLSRHRGRLLLWAGPEIGAEAHALAHALNQAFAGRLVSLIEPPDLHANALPAPGTLADLTEGAMRGDVQTLVILGGSNPVYAAPKSLRFEAALAHVPMSLHAGLYRDETARRCQWHLPAGHEFEQWGDARAFDGTATLMQPAIAPLYDTRSPQELLALLGGNAAPDGHALLRAHWQTLGDADFEASLRRGFIAGSAAKPVPAPMVRIAAPPALAADIESTLWAVFPADASVGDGEHANNGWLQELPRPFTKIAWGNALQLGPRTAAALGLASGDLVRASTAGGGMVEDVPVWVQPGHAEGAATLPNGFGRQAAGRVGNGVGVDNAGLRSATLVAVPLTLKRSGSGHRFALTQVDLQQHGRELARTMPIKPEPQQPTLYAPTPAAMQSGPAWGMAIDLDACIGCNVCTVACQAENNIPVVGPDEVRLGRAMHWIRVDAYLEEAGDEAPQRTITQPVACMHCENAPCELVCPVGATVHDSEGLNVQVYNRCVGTRFCSNNCPYKVRRFNFRQYNDLKTETLKLMRNPDVTVRDRGVMEKCSYCVQRLSRARRTEQRTGEALPRDAVQTACQSACLTGAIHFGDLNDAHSDVSLAKASPRNYAMLGELNTRPRTTYLARQAPLPKEDA